MKSFSASDLLPPLRAISPETYIVVAIFGIGRDAVVEVGLGSLGVAVAQVGANRDRSMTRPCWLTGRWRGFLKYYFSFF